MKSSSKIEIRKLLPQDNVADIAKYIYYTDDYIYPDMAESPQSKAWINYIESCLCEKNSVFSKENFIVALCDCKIIGLACVLECGKTLHLANNPKGLKHSFQNAYDGYFVPLIEQVAQMEGFYLCNLCVDESYRGCGIGRKILRKVSEFYNNGPVSLDAIADNAAAITLYESEGYIKTEEYSGYGGSKADELLCVHMVKAKEKGR